MAPLSGTAEVYGRGIELDVVRRWVDELGNGPSALVISGPAGIGKSVIWNLAAAQSRAHGARILASRPVEAELPYGYAALADLLSDAGEPILEELPPPQARALAAALSIGDVDREDSPLLVGRATLGALRLLAASGPVVIAIDDVQWLDPPTARALGYAARRLVQSPVGFVVSVRDGHDEPMGLGPAFDGAASRIQLAGLDLQSTGRLLRGRVDPDIARPVVTHVHRQSAGNPFFALELARGGTDQLPASLEELLRRRLERVGSPATSIIEQVAVLGPMPLGWFDDLAALDDAVTAAILVEDSDIVRFVHPLLAAGAYERIPPGRRRSLHRRAADSASGLEQRARHLALAATGPDPATSAILEGAARAARLRGAPETAVGLAEQARRLTPREDEEDLARRAMDQAEYLYLAADERGARQLVDELLAGPVHGAIRVRALAQRALTAIDAPSAVASLEAAVAEPHADRLLATRTLAQLAWQRGAWLGDLEPAIGEALEALRLAEDLGDPSTLVTSLTTAGLLLSLAGHPGAADHFRRALDILDRQPSAAGDHTPRLAFAHERWWRGDFATAEALLLDERRLAEQYGDEGLLVRLDVFGAEFALRTGRWDDAERRAEAALAEARDYWRMMALIRRGILRARRGDQAAASDAAELRASPIGVGDPIIAAAGDFVSGLLAVARGDMSEAAAQLVRLPRLIEGSGSRRAEFANLILDAVAVLVASGGSAEAEVLTEQLERRRSQLGEWGDAGVSLCRGLLRLGAGDTAEALRLLDVAVTGFDALGARWELGLSLLSAGTAARRAGARRRAAETLERSVSVFEELGAVPWRERAAEELRLARPRPRQDDRLTEAEARVAALVAEGHTNREVAARLFTTVGTVEAHLTRIYGKLGLRSRTELSRHVVDGSLRL